MLPALAHLSPDDQATFFANSFGPHRTTPFPIIHHAFEHHAHAQPHSLAVEHTLFNHTLTYAQLDTQANRLARRLREYGIRPGHRVCILARRSVYIVVAILAVLKSGAQYVPMDAVTITDSTIEHILHDSAPSLVLVMEEYVHRVSGPPSLCLEDAIAADEESGADGSKPEDLSSPTDGAYVIYTSGTTGVPKGVDVRHNGITNVISGPPGNVSMRPGMRVAQLLNIAFDMGAWEILSSLYNGCTLCIRGNTSKEWVALMKTVDVVICTPSILARHEPEDYPGLKHVIVGGEACSQALADKWAAHTQFNNCCGPTEISICNTVQPHTPGYPLSIGTPIPNTNVYILASDPDPSFTALDTNTASTSTNTRNPPSPSTSTSPGPHPSALPIGAVGSMWVGGIGVSNGYLNLPSKTAERFLPDPFLPPGNMMFNTGDLGRWRPDGQLEHHGRADDQVKVKGFRVELDGVASAMRTHTPVREAVALLIGVELWGFVTPASVDLPCVRAATARMQPYYAVPSQYLALSEFPMTRNGKVDKRALAVMAAAGGSAASGAGAADAGARRLSVRNGGVPFSGSLPGTPLAIAEQPASKWIVPSTLPPLAEIAGSPAFVQVQAQGPQPQPPIEREIEIRIPDMNMNILDCQPAHALPTRLDAALFVS
ncbi:acetyl-CoA synthetase-like protein [Ramaria rubella]|nr:acetyl-CoA synthetase-like protein [Ramaria rubella]